MEVSHIKPCARQPIQVVSGVCTLQCANAPVINVQKHNSAGGTVHHSKVDSAERCRLVVEDAAGLQLAPPASIMMRRADGLRWNALRQLARLRRQQTQPQVQREPQSRELALALQAETRAVRADLALAERARRRAARLTQQLIGQG